MIYLAFSVFFLAKNVVCEPIVLLLLLFGSFRVLLFGRFFRFRFQSHQDMCWIRLLLCSVLVVFDDIFFVRTNDLSGAIHAVYELFAFVTSLITNVSNRPANDFSRQFSQIS